MCGEAGEVTRRTVLKHVVLKKRHILFFSASGRGCGAGRIGGRTPPELKSLDCHQRMSDRPVRAAKTAAEVRMAVQSVDTAGVARQHGLSDAAGNRCRKSKSSSGEQPVQKRARRETDLQLAIRASLAECGAGHTGGSPVKHCNAGLLRASALPHHTAPSAGAGDDQHGIATLLQASEHLESEACGVFPSTVPERMLSQPPCFFGQIFRLL